MTDPRTFEEEHLSAITRRYSDPDRLERDWNRRISSIYLSGSAPDTVIVIELDDFHRNQHITWRFPIWHDGTGEPSTDGPETPESFGVIISAHVEDPAFPLAGVSDFDAEPLA